MTYNTTFCKLLASVLILVPSISAAGINKCIDAAGVVTYSDQPCATQGQKPAEVKNATGFAMLAAQEHQKELVRSCTALTERRGQCRIFVESRLDTIFNDNCAPLIKRAYQDRQREAYRRYQTRRYGQDSAGSSDEEPQSKIDCGKLEAEMYKLVKTNFSEDLSPEDARAIEYKLQAVPFDGNERPLSTRRGRRY